MDTSMINIPPPPSEPTEEASPWGSTWDRVPLEALDHKTLAEALGDLPAVIEADGHLVVDDKFCCPFHKDTRPSASLYQRDDGGVRFKCFGCDAGGSVFDYVMLRDGVDFSTAREWVIDQIIAQAIAGKSPRTRTVSKKRTTTAPIWPHLWPGSERQWRALAELRRISVEAVKKAAERGLLSFGRTEDFYNIDDWHDFWGITDGTRRNLQIRKITGDLWKIIGLKKARTWTGCRATWPVGLGQAKDKILLVEGGPDLLAAFHFLHQMADDTWSPVAMLGAGLKIQKEDLPFFVGKHVRIVPHLDLEKDRVGQKAAKKWANQLRGTACKVDGFNLEGLRKMDGTMVEDLNDCTTIQPSDAPALGGLLA